MRLLALEKGIPFETVSEWIKKAKRAGMLNPDEPIPAMVEVKAARPGSGDGNDIDRKGDGDDAIVALSQVLEALPRQ